MFLAAITFLVFFNLINIEGAEMKIYARWIHIFLGLETKIKVSKFLNTDLVLFQKFLNNLVMYFKKKV